MSYQGSRRKGEIQDEDNGGSSENNLQMHSDPFYCSTVWMAATSTVESFEFSGRHGFHMMLIPFLHEVEELRPKVEAYLTGRQDTTRQRRACSACIIYMWVKVAEARAVAAPGLKEEPNHVK